MACTCPPFKFSKLTPNAIAYNYYREAANYHRKMEQKALKSEKFQNKKNFLYDLIESFYERCAAYNLRYCVVSTYSDLEGYYAMTMKDFWTLLFFLAANTIVFFVISCNMIIHMSYAILHAVRWVTSCIRHQVRPSRSFAWNTTKDVPSVPFRQNELHKNADVVKELISQYPYSESNILHAMMLRKHKF